MRSAVIVLTIAVLVRLIYALQLFGTPCAWQHLWTQSDMNYFHTWALQLAGGDWLTRDVPLPMHDWQRRIAREHLAEHPEDKDRLASLGSTADSEAALWRDWQGPTTFYQDPLYPYLVGLTYWLFGPDQQRVFLWQMMAGVCSTMLIYRISCRCFGPLAGLTSGVLAALCPPLFFYDLILLRTSLIVLFSLLLVALTLKLQDGAAKPWWVLTGIVCGAAFCLKSSLALLILGLAVGLGCGLVHQPRKRSIQLLLLCLGVVLALVPLGLRNRLVDAPLLSTASGGAITFISHNASDYDAARGGFQVSRHAARIMDLSHGKLLPAAVETIRTHTPASYILQVTQKASLALHNIELPNNANLYVYQLYAEILQLPIRFMLIAALGLPGAALALRRFGSVWPLYVLAASTLATLLGFMVMSRLRLPLTTSLILFSGFTVQMVCHQIQHKMYMALTLLLGAAVGIAAGTLRPIPQRGSTIRLADCKVPHLYYYVPKINAALNSGDITAALELSRQSLQIIPNEVRALQAGSGTPSKTIADLGVFYAHVYRAAAALHQQYGEQDMADRFLRRAAVLEGF